MAAGASLVVAGSVSEQRRERVERALSAAGVELAARTTGPVVLLFDTISPRLHELVGTLCDRGADPVLAVGAGRRSFGRVAATELLHAGAADVLRWDAKGVWAHAVAARLERWRRVSEVLASPIVRDCP